MGELFAVTQYSLVLPHYRIQAWSQRHQSFAGSLSLSSILSTTPQTVLANIHTQQKQILCGVRASVTSDSIMPTTFTADSAGQGIEFLPDRGGGGDDSGRANGNSGGGGDNGGNSNNNDGSEDGGPDEGKDDNSDSRKKKMALSMSQKLTLGYAFLVGAGGVMGYLKRGSTKSLIAGGLSASFLFSVYTMLPTQPVFASSMGFIFSAALLGVMGSRFLKSMKIFPAGVVSFVSLVMSGGYLHGILRSVH